MRESREAEVGGVGTFKGGIGGQEMEKAGAHLKFFFAPSWLEILLGVLLFLLSVLSSTPPYSCHCSFGMLYTCSCQT